MSFSIYELFGPLYSIVDKVPKILKLSIMSYIDHIKDEFYKMICFMEQDRNSFVFRPKEFRWRVNNINMSVFLSYSPISDTLYVSKVQYH